ncbi:MAG: hypothetical protein DME19_04880 [Verrucomicrobia bacterium]|nr:MAG: hypothetical protein DME19_04880 [Verrucomicrobiota bacterium]
MTLSRLTGFVRLETVVAKLRLRESPAGAPELLNKAPPFSGRKRSSGSARRPQFNSVRQSLRRVPFAQYHFADGKRSDETKFVRGRVE